LRFFAIVFWTQTLIPSSILATHRYWPCFADSTLLSHYIYLQYIIENAILFVFLPSSCTVVFYLTNIRVLERTILIAMLLEIPELKVVSLLIYCSLPSWFQNLWKFQNRKEVVASWKVLVGNGKIYKVEFEHGRTSGKRVLYINDEVKLAYGKRI
jgi:Fas apoptotic inhibitory molecule (FAIM1)